MSELSIYRPVSDKERKKAREMERRARAESHQRPRNIVPFNIDDIVSDGDEEEDHISPAYSPTSPIHSNTSAAAANTNTSAAARDIMVIDDDTPVASSSTPAAAAPHVVHPHDQADFDGKPINFEIGVNFVTASGSDVDADTFLHCVGCQEVNYSDPIEFGCRRHTMHKVCLANYLQSKIDHENNYRSIPLSDSQKDVVKIRCPTCQNTPAIVQNPRVPPVEEKDVATYGSLKNAVATPSMLFVIQVKQCKCPNEGCGKVMNFGRGGANELAHARTCEHRVYHCIHPGCSESFKRGVNREAVEAHKAACPHVPVLCEHCHKSFPKSANHGESCESRMVQCVSCDTSVRFADYATHLMPVVAGESCGGFVACPNGCMQVSQVRVSGEDGVVTEVEKVKPLTFKDLDAHILSCPNRMVECILCHETHKASEVALHDKSRKRKHQAIFLEATKTVVSLSERCAAMEARMAQFAAQLCAPSTRVYKPEDHGFFEVMSECFTGKVTDLLSTIKFVAPVWTIDNTKGVGNHHTKIEVSRINYQVDNRGSFSLVLKRVRGSRSDDRQVVNRVDWRVRLSQVKARTDATVIPFGNFDQDAIYFACDWIPIQTSFVISEDQRVSVGNLERFLLNSPLTICNGEACFLVEVYAKVRID